MLFHRGSTCTPILCPCFLTPEALNLKTVTVRGQGMYKISCNYQVYPLRMLAGFGYIEVFQFSDVAGVVRLSTYRLEKIPGRRAVAFLLNLISALVQFVRQIDLGYWKTPWQRWLGLLFLEVEKSLRSTRWNGVGQNDNYLQLVVRCSSVPSAYCVVALFSLRFPPPLSKLSPSVAAAGGVIGVLAGSVWLCVCRIGGWLANAVAVVR